MDLSLTGIVLCVVDVGLSPDWKSRQVRTAPALGLAQYLVDDNCSPSRQSENLMVYQTVPSIHLVRLNLTEFLLKLNLWARRRQLTC